MSIYWNDGTELYHYGIPGQKWGVRRYQNPDGTLTEEGKRRYRKLDTYRNTLASRSRKKSDYGKRNAEEAKIHYQNVKLLGKDSLEYREYVRDKMKDTDDDWNDEDTLKKNRRDNTITALTYYEPFDLLGIQKQTVNELLAKYSSEESDWKAYSERWMKSNEALMNMDIDVFMSKKDIRKNMRNAQH